MPPATELDAARLTIAAAGSLQVKHSLQTLGRFRVLTDTQRRPDAEGAMPGGAAARSRPSTHCGSHGSGRGRRNPAPAGRFVA